jgi:hypothetical protein
MAELFLTGVKSAAARKWLQVVAARDGVTWFDLLGVPEDCTRPGW